VLRAVSEVRWKAFVREASAIEAVLAEDPAAVYRRMDFDSCDRYRRAVEDLSRGSRHSEVEVARRALAHAREAAAEGDLRRGHVGYWLVDDGRGALERSIQFRAPARDRLRRAILRRPGAWYAGALGLFTAAGLAPAVAILVSQGAGPLLLALGVALALPPAAAFAVAAVNGLATRILPPRTLPRLFFGAGIPTEARTAVVVPVLLGGVEDVVRLARRLEIHYLGNPDPNLSFSLLTDLVDASERETPGDREILDRAVASVRRLNERYGTPGRLPFHLLHRERRWNPAEGSWMGWERKRGKLEEFDRLVAGARDTSFVLHEGDPEALRGVRYVLTLDADTRLPRGMPARLVGILAHPLNRAVLDEAGRVVSGYTVVQPRVEVDPESAGRSRFARICAGDSAVDIYSRAVSDAYQDLFGEGIFVGKGLYDAVAFRRTLEGRIPENAIVSHDLLEGGHGRVGLATDALVYETCPHHPVAHSRRLHRWIRGDWQLLPWLLPRVRDASGARTENRLRPLDRWKAFDNLRRSLLSPSLLALFAAAWTVLPGSPLLWTLFGALLPVLPLLAGLATGIGRGRAGSPVLARLRAAARGTRDGAARWLLVLAFLPHDARVACDAALRAIWRLAVSRRRLLEWTTAAHTARALARHGARAVVWTEMAAGPLAAVALGVAAASLRPTALPVALPFLLLWCLAPELAIRWSRPLERPEAPTTPDEDLALRRLARRTWFFFATFVGPDDQWLPPDNVQEDPPTGVAHRTSPTNVGAMLLSTLSAWDLGYLGPSDLRVRVRATLETLGRMERYRGHLLNWYDTRTLEPLLPRYVSTVDSGNLAGALWTLEQGLAEVADGPVFSSARWEGLRDTLALFEEAVDRVLADGRDESLETALGDLRERLAALRADPGAGSRALARLGEAPVELARAIAAALDRSGTRHEAGALRELRIWTDRLHQGLHALARDRDLLLPWLPLLEAPPASAQALAARLLDLLPPTVALRDVASRVDAATSLLAPERDPDGGPEAAAWAAALRAALEAGAARVQEIRGDLRALAARARAEVDGMDFGVLYDRDAHLFHIGHNVTADRVDPNRYDLLASEARLASLVAIAKGDVPQKHWFFLGRPVTRTASGPALLSWGGTMFEYLMPALLLRPAHGTLVDRSQRAAVEEQLRYAARLGIPWGISESGYAAFDADRNYQYRAFGVPGLGLKRGLEEEVVVSSYASLLALPVRPREVARNLVALREIGMLSTYGLYEAADATPARLPEGRRFVLVRSYMAHHQGMILTALANHLCGDAMARRFRAVPRVRAVDLLLHERAPADAPAEEPHGDVPASHPVEDEAPRLPSWSPPAAGAYPEIVALGNGRLCSLVTDSGAGGLRWQEHAVTRWAPGPTLDAAGLWIYVRDEESGALWSAGRQPTGARPDDGGVQFHPHVAEFHRHDHGIALRMEVVVAPADDVEVRRVTLVNETHRPRRVSLTSCAEVVLSGSTDVDRHPAFERLFVWSEPVPGSSGLLFGRRPRRPEEDPPVLFHRVLLGRRGRLDGFETDRRRFLGRNGTWRSPRAARQPLSGTAGVTLDTVAALRAVVDLPPLATETVAFLTIVGASRAGVLETARRYDALGSIDWMLRDARAESAREARRTGIEPGAVPDAHRLLSLVLHPHGPLRGDPRAIEANRLGQPALWGFGISGDLPILLVRVADLDASPCLRDVVRAHALWRRRGVAADLVLLREGPSSYADDVDGRLQRAVRESGGEAWLGRRGGVFLVRADQTAPEQRRLLEAAGRVVLDASAGPLASQLARLHAAGTPLPPFTATEEPGPEPAPAVPPPRDLLFPNPLGGFTKDGRGYVVHLEPRGSTPAPWANVISNGPRFGFLVTEAGFGPTWSENAAERRLTPWSNDPVADPPSEVLYLRDEATAEVWTVTPRPAGQGSACRVRHGAGTTEWTRRDHGLAQTLLVFAASDDPVKLVRLRVENLRSRPRRLTVTYYAQWVLGSTTEIARAFVVPEYDAGSQSLLARNPWNPDHAARTAFLVSDRKPHGFTTDRAEFLGREGDLSAPAGLHRWGLSGAVAPGRDPCAALQVHVDLAPGEEAVLHFALGEGADREDAVRLVSRWRSREAVEAERERVRARWDATLGRVEVETPDRALDLVVNRWLLYQTLASRVLGRSGFYQSSGAYGFRDQIQDVLALVHVDPALCRSHLLECARHQFEEGDVMHWWHAPTDRGVRTRCSDDLLWLPYATAHYVEATGDDGVLEERVPYLRAEPLRPDEHDRYSRFEGGGEARSLWDHCVRALERGSTAGPRGLPRMGDGDWNDGMDRVGREGRGESVWLAWFLAATLEAASRLADRRGEPERAAAWRLRARETARAAEEHGWDGAWYRRAFDDEGHVLGSSQNGECRIDSIAQSWAVLSGAADRDRAVRAVRAAERELTRDPELLALLWPPFDRTTLEPGYVKAYPPGIRENGGQYNHAAAWLGLAFAATGDGERAWRVFRRINPVSRASTEEALARYRVEPYVVAGDVYTAGPHAGRGGWTWYTGASAWTWRLAVEGLLGLRLVSGALLVDPSIPPSWPGYDATIRGEGGTLEVHVENPDRTGRGVAEATLDGVRVEPGRPVSLPSDGGTHRLDVVLGSARAAAPSPPAARARSNPAD
jgi:cyclic beta-1,2-glucan synthetase